MWSRGYAAQETQAAFASAEAFAEALEGRVRRFDLYHGQWLATLMRGDLASARDTAETFVSEATMSGAPPDLAYAKSQSYRQASLMPRPIF